VVGIKKTKVYSCCVDTYIINKKKEMKMTTIMKQAELGDVDARSTLYKIFAENYQQEFDCWTKNLYSSREWMDVEDMKQDIYMESVEFHINNHKHYNKNCGEDYLIKKSIRQTISKYVKKQSYFMDKPHTVFEQKNGGNCIRRLAETYSLDTMDKDTQLSKSKDNVINMSIHNSFVSCLPVPDSDLSSPLDKLIYEEFVELLLEKVKYYQIDYVYDLRKIIIYLLDGENSTTICRRMGMDKGKRISNAIRELKKIKTDVLLPLALTIIDDKRYTDKYWDVLSKKTKTLFFSQKNT